MSTPDQPNTPETQAADQSQNSLEEMLDWFERSQGDLARIRAMSQAEADLAQILDRANQSEGAEES